MSSADEQYAELMRVAPKPSTPTELVVAEPRKFWRAVVKCKEAKQNGVNGITRSEIEWHSASCAAPLNDCHGCQP